MDQYLSKGKSPRGASAHRGGHRIGETIRLAPKETPGAESSITETALTAPPGGIGSHADTADLPSSDKQTKFPHLEDASGRILALRPGVNTVGREGTDILIPDRSVSRYHAIIVFDEERDLFSVEDSGSRNGTRVGADILAPRQSAPIHPGDSLRFGNVNVRFAVAGQARIAPSDEIESCKAEPTLPSSSYPIEMVAVPAGRLILAHANNPREFVLEQGINTIGRNPDNNISFPEDRYVSGHHARIDVEGDNFLLVDMGSTNGTYLNGLRLTTNTPISIDKGDEIMIGGLLFRFHTFAFDPATTPSDRTMIGNPSIDQITRAILTSNNGA